MRKLALAIVAVAAFLITPYFLYTEVIAFQFGEAEMRGAVEGTWVVELAPSEGAPRSITLGIEQARSAKHSARERGLIRSASACGHRTFVRSAEACLDISELELKLTAMGGDPPDELSGRFTVTGTTFERGDLELVLGGLSIRAEISSSGDVLEVRTTRGPAPRLARIAPRAAGK